MHYSAPISVDPRRDGDNPGGSTMEKKELKRILAGVSIATLVAAGVTTVAVHDASAA
jgi:radical SAM modification target selenobiotic family peptide